MLPARPALLQYHNKSTDPALRLAQAQNPARAHRAAGVGLIINDDVALAAWWAPTACTWPRRRRDIAAARARLAEHAILGASCYDQLPLAHAAIAAGADFVAFGAVCPPPPNRTPCAPCSVCLPTAPHWARRAWRLAASPRPMQARLSRPAIYAGGDWRVFDAEDPLAAACALSAGWRYATSPGTKLSGPRA